MPPEEVSNYMLAKFIKVEWITLFLAGAIGLGTLLTRVEAQGEVQEAQGEKITGFDNRFSTVEKDIAVIRKEQEYMAEKQREFGESLRRAEMDRRETTRKLDVIIDRLSDGQ